ncbi:cytochrome c peroxidase [Novosphingobium sp. JCM 18896]|uniref:cytochrome c peroxidase n=1 Tax=Novosphingobium sp. JCM 18896 TaxID=2989731 RepID=UPI0029CAA0AB|nr:cytochrome c peroxidase [Novosphingobium sp. JCM 18896]
MAPLAGLALAGASAPAWHWSSPRGLGAPEVPADNPMTSAKVELGRRLFYDADLSLDGTMSCATCHEQHRAFAEGNRTHPGVTGEAGWRNVQALANVAWFTRLTHADPSLASLEGQVAVPVFGTHPVEMGMTGREAELAARLGRDDCYRAQFREAFPETEGRIDETTIAKALASFERTLVSFGSPHDHGRLPHAARGGRAIFARDCTGCHAGPLFTDMAYHRLAESTPADPGLAEKSGRVEDRGKFRTPSLRNVALTAPYWHDGSVPTLEAALDRHEGRRYSPEEKASLLAFLDVLTDREFVERKDLALPMTACGKPL